MTCQELVDQLVDYLDGTLAEEKRTEFNKHLAECANCVAYLTSYQKTVLLGKLLKSKTDGSDQPEIPDVLVQAILEARAEEEQRDQ